MFRTLIVTALSLASSVSGASAFGQVISRDSCVVVEAKEVGRDRSNVGTAAGAAVGAAIGSRFGDGNGKTLMTVLGGIAGASAGGRAAGDRVYRYDVYVRGQKRIISVTQKRASGLSAGTTCVIESDGRDARVRKAE